MTQTAPNLLDADGSASMATMFMMSHHGLRRDLARFAIALGTLGDDGARAAALREEWERYRGTLHGHHTVEDERMFPDMKANLPALAPVIDRLLEEHRRIDPLLGYGDRVFAELPASKAAALAVVSELRGLLDEHLATEEREIVPHLRGATEFPAPGSEAELEMYADGFAWSLHGVAAEIGDRVKKMLPEALVSRLPAACAKFEERCVRVWGSAKAGASRTPIPDWL